MASPSKQSSNLLSRLPFELLYDISSKYLDSESLKALRAASPRGVVPKATEPLLFRNLRLRLGNHPDSQQKVARLHEYLEYYSSQTRASLQKDTGRDATTGGIFQYARKLFVDTRYPFVVTADLIFAREEYTDMNGGNFNFYDKKTNGHEVPVTTEEMKLFSDALKHALTLLKNQLVSIRWQTSDAFPRELHDDIATALCVPETQRRYSLSVSLKIRDFRATEKYLQNISHCSTLEVDYQNSHAKKIFEPNVQFVGDTIRRCGNLKAFAIDFQGHGPSYQAKEELWKTLESVETLESLELKACDPGILPENPPKPLAKNLQRLGLIKRPFFSPYNHDDKLLVFINSLAASGTQLQRLALTMYSPEIHRFLLQQKRLEDLEIRTKSGIRMESHAEEFWNQVIPNVQGTLKRLKVYDYNDGPFSWYPYPNNLARERLAHCKQLEEVLITFIDPDNRNGNFILEMIESMMETCPKLHIIYIKFGFGLVHPKITQTERLLDRWESKNSIVFLGRTLDLIYDKKTYIYETFDLTESQTILPPISYDVFIQRWKLVQEIDSDGRNVYRIKRMEDEYSLFT
ncbi:hypothetical protein AA313_de0202831 [Arthrobotrys entomopaga]|nr:hypothetical protein AA313_de0202831 [Arthrobotrys entomopaga]